jgi:Ca-activated chloride channel homolog
MQVQSTSFAMLIAVTLITWTLEARADAVLQAKQNIFPQEVAISVEVRAQVELTTVVLTFPALTDREDAVLTVPSPKGAYPVGVDLDRGKGFVELPIKDEAPPPPAGGSTSPAAMQAWVGQTPLTANLHDLASGPLTIRVSFLRLLRRYQGKVTFLAGAAPCPLRQPSHGSASVTLSVRVRTARPLIQIGTANNVAKVHKSSSTEAQLSVAKTLLIKPVHVLVSYAEQTKGIQAQLLTHRTPTADPQGGQAGYFLLLLDADHVSAETTQPRTLSLVIDRSGSMSGDKLAQAQKSALAMLDNLRPSDRFNLHHFNSTIDSFNSAPLPATPGNIAAAKAHATSLTAQGSTDLNDGIIAGLGGKTCPTGAPPDARYDAMILLSDGQPTAGVVDRSQIHNNSILHNCNESRIFTFAVGYGADVALLEAIARTARGRNFVLNNAQAGVTLAEQARLLFEEIYAVRVTDLSLSISGITTRDVLPERPPDLFNGGQVVLVGRYQAPGQGTARITGKAEGKAHLTQLPLLAPALEQDNGFIKYVWATEKVGSLLAALGRGGDANQLEQQITALGLAYRIQTPYTSFSSPNAGATPGISGSGGGGYSGGSGGGGGGYSGSGDVSLVGLLALLGLVPLARRRLRGG